MRLSIIKTPALISSFTVALLLLLMACTASEPKLEVKKELGTVLEEADVEGSILIYDLNKNTFYSNDFEFARTGSLPASTFKITNAMIALETGIMEDDSTMIKWDGQPRRIKLWERDLVFRDAFHVSCVPCYREIARNIGVDRMNEYLEKFDYGNMIVDSSNIDLFWLEGDSKITQFEQIDFLKRFHESSLDISKRTETIMKRLMILEESEEYTLRAKTGWSIREGHNTGWFVGYLEKADNTYIFATKINPKEAFNMHLFPKIRNEVTMTGFEALSILK